jgi:hypothetical protein
MPGGASFLNASRYLAGGCSLSAEVGWNDGEVDPVVDQPLAVLVGEDEEQRLRTRGRQEWLVEDDEGGDPSIGKERDIGHGDEPDQRLLGPRLGRGSDAGTGQFAILGVKPQ